MDNRTATLLTRGSSLTRAEYRVLAHLTEHPLLVGNITVRELAQATFVSTATIMRLCQKLGFSGFSEFIWHCKQLLSDTPHITVQPEQHAEMPALLPGSLPTISRPSSGSLRTNASSLPACCARRELLSLRRRVFVPFAEYLTKKLQVLGKRPSSPGRETAGIFFSATPRAIRCLLPFHAAAKRSRYWIKRGSPKRRHDDRRVYPRVGQYAGGYGGRAFCSL